MLRGNGKAGRRQTEIFLTEEHKGAHGGLCLVHAKGGMGDLFAVGKIGLITATGGKVKQGFGTENSREGQRGNKREDDQKKNLMEAN